MRCLVKELVHHMEPQKLQHYSLSYYIFNNSNTELLLTFIQLLLVGNV